MSGLYLPEGWHNGSEENKKISSVSELSRLVSENEIYEAVAVMCDAKHNLIVDMGFMRGIIPREEGAEGISDGTVRDIALISRVGKPVCFTVSGIKTDSDQKPLALLSRKNAQVLCRKNYLSFLKKGDIICAKITHLENFGAFCDIGCGIVALLPIDAISVSRISHPSDRFSVGDNIKAVVKDISQDGRITLSLKELLGTWSENAKLIAQGETISGIVRSIESYGIFVELMPNLAGLAELKDDVYVGQQASIYIKSIIPEKMKVKLIIIDSFDGEKTLPIRYFYDKPHMDIWKYSPDNCLKDISTQF